LRLAAYGSVALCGVGAGSSAADEIHSFTDDRGVAHFSNVPADPRYRLYLRERVETGLAPAAGDPAVILFAPPMVERGSEFVVNLLLSNAGRIYGSLEIGFDPAVLSFKNATVRHEVLSAGRVRLNVEGDPSPDYAADLRFRVRASAASETSIRLAQSSLTAANGKPATVGESPSMSIAVLRP
jgi:hypothetical protein